MRYADDFVVMVHGSREQAEDLREEVAAILAGVGLTLAPEKTRVAGIDEGFDLLAACSREPCTMTTKSSAYRTKR